MSSEALSISLAKVANNLSLVQHAFSVDFARLEKSEAVNVNPESMLSRIRALKEKVEGLGVEATKLVSERPQLVKETSQALLENYLTLGELAKRTNHNDAPVVENPFAEQSEVAADRQQLALDVANQLKLVEGGDVSEIVAKVIADGTKVSAASTTNSNPSSKSKNSGSNAPAQSLPATVNDEEFDSLSNSVRGRAKIESLNALVLHLTSLHNATMALKKGHGGKSYASNYYTLKELDRAGFKVTGATGTNILRSLTTLGRIVVDKKEGVRLSVL